MKIIWDNTLQFCELTDRLKKALDAYKPRCMDNPGYRRAAVMILLLEKENAPYVLLTLRSEGVKTHKNQISFPGGGFDSSDASILDTAYRETLEETGISPQQITLLGRFDDYISIFGFHISVFAGTIANTVEYCFNPDEIDAYIEAPLEIFIRQQYDRLEYYTHEEKEYTIHHYIYSEFDIWGLTARILTDFTEKMFIVHE